MSSNTIDESVASPTDANSESALRAQLLRIDRYQQQKLQKEIVYVLYESEVWPSAGKAIDELVVLFHEQLKAKVAEADRRTLETLAAILSGSGKTVINNQSQDEKKTIEVAQNYIHNKLLVLKKKKNNGRN